MVDTLRAGGTMARTIEQQLANYENRYRQLAAQLADIGMISAGTLTRRYTRCASPGCKCRANSNIEANG